MQTNKVASNGSKSIELVEATHNISLTAIYMWSQVQTRSSTL